MVYAIMFKTSKFDSCGITTLYFENLCNLISRTSKAAIGVPFCEALIIRLPTIGCASVVFEPITIINSVL